MRADRRAVRVVKFGGSCFVDLADFHTAAGYLARISTRDKVVAVVSGMSGTTGRLLEAARTIDPALQPQVQDQVLATAEMVGASFLRAALHARECPATDLWAHQLGFRSDGVATRAAIRSVDPAPLLEALATHRVVVVAGGQAVDGSGRITMLGRNSSDLTAVAVAAALGLDRCELFSDVPGVYTADPHVVPSARLIVELSYAQCAQMSRSGAKVLHTGSVEHARQHGVRIVCRALGPANRNGGPVVTTGTTVGAGIGLTAVVGDKRAELYRVAGAAADALATARAAGFTAVEVEHAGETLIAFTGAQAGVADALALAGVTAEPATGLGIVSVVDPDGSVVRGAAPLSEVDTMVARLHERRYGRPDQAVPAGPAPKRRSGHSDLLTPAPRKLGAGEPRRLVPRRQGSVRWFAPQAPLTRSDVHDLPSVEESVAYVRSLGKPTVAELLEESARKGVPLVQARSGVGTHRAMLELLTGLESAAAPDVATVTIDSHTRLLRFDNVRRALAEDPANLNGYPLVTHGWRLGRELNEAVRAPVQVRHGSPDARLLFHTSVASGFSAFEGGGIGYNVPYAKNVPITESLRSWQEIDRATGELTAAGLTIDRELFGTLTGVLMPPAISLAMTILEAVLAAAEGVRCISISYPQGGHPWQDIAALRAIPRLAAHYLNTHGPDGVRVYTVLHQFMGVFPMDGARAVDLIIYGGLIATLGRVNKVITKSPAEASGIPTMAENASGINATRVGMGPAYEWFAVDEAAVAGELLAIEREVHELVDPVLDAPDLVSSIGLAFADGRLDVPFSASRFVRSAVMPCRDRTGAIRYADCGALPFSIRTRRANDEHLNGPRGAVPVDRLLADVEYFANAGRIDPLRWLRPSGVLR